MKVLVTGANGFLGKVLCDLLRFKVQLITTDKVGENLDFKGDLSDYNFVQTLPDVDVLLHLASVQYVTNNIPLFFRKKFFFKNNVDSAKNLIARYKNKLDYFLNVSTSMVYEQKHTDLYTTNADKKPVGIYSKTKLIALNLFQDQMNAKKQANLYPCIILGEGREGLFRSFIGLINKYKIVVFPGACVQKTAVVHVQDVATTITELMLKEKIGDYNISSIDNFSIKEWVARIEFKLQKRAKYKIKIPLWLLKIGAFLTAYRILAKEQMLMLEYPHILDIERNLKEGIKPKITVNQAIDDIVDYIIK